MLPLVLNFYSNPFLWLAFPTLCQWRALSSILCHLYSTDKIFFVLNTQCIRLDFFPQELYTFAISRTVSNLMHKVTKSKEKNQVKILRKHFKKQFGITNANLLNPLCRSCICVSFHRWVAFLVFAHKCHFSDKVANTQTIPPLFLPWSSLSSYPHDKDQIIIIILREAYL